VLILDIGSLIRGTITERQNWNNKIFSSAEY
jgi:hypothetical protein